MNKTPKHTVYLGEDWAGLLTKDYGSNSLMKTFVDILPPHKFIRFMFRFLKV